MRSPFRAPLVVAAALAAGSLAWATPTSDAGTTRDDPTRPAVAAGPNVLIMLLDDARTGQTSVMPRTMSWLGGTGTVYPRAMVTTPSCCPSRATMFSGRYAHNHRVTQQAAIGNFDHARSLQHDLKAAGYRTAAVGKLFNAWKIANRPPYFDNWALTGGGYDNARFVVDGRTVRAPYSTSFVGQQINRYVDAFERDDARPWFLYAGFTAPHAPFTPEPKYARLSYPWAGNPATRERDRSDKPAYVRRYAFTEAQGADVRQAMLRTLRSVDDAIDAVRARLAARGELANTLVILLSDNGKLWGEHRLQEKFMPYTQAESVPLVISWPGRLPRGTDHRLATNLDIAPTVLHAAGVNPSYQVDGRSLLSGSRRDRVLSEYWRDPANGAGIPTWASTVVPGRYRYTEIYTDGGSVLEREYYNLASDPWQLTNLLRDGVAGNDPNLAPLAAALAAQRRCAGTVACP